jgi:hypothetical protein
MGLWWQIPLLLCALALTAALVAALLALRRTLQRTEELLAALGQEVPPALQDLRHLTQEAQGVAREARGGINRVGAMVERASQVAEGVGALVAGLRGLTRAGQIIGIAAGLRKGLEVFIDRVRTPHGGKHG